MIGAASHRRDALCRVIEDRLRMNFEPGLINRRWEDSYSICAPDSPHRLWFELDKAIRWGPTTGVTAVTADPWVVPRSRQTDAVAAEGHTTLRAR